MKLNKIILIEDDQKKIKSIKIFFKNNFPEFELSIKESYQTGLRELLYNQYDLLLLDMSMPTWDKSVDEPGGEFEKFAGIKILNEIERKNKQIYTILITMFDTFGEGEKLITLVELNSQLKEKFNKFFKGSVFYNSAESKWQENLTNLIKEIFLDEDSDSR